MRLDRDDLFARRTLADMGGWGGGGGETGWGGYGSLI